MKKNKKILVTAALPYANGPIHLGHLAGAYLPADIYVRYQRARNRDIIFICGSDEHGVPITIAAERQNVTPQAIVDKYYQIHKDSFEKFGIQFDNYSRTSLKIHHKMSQDIFLKLHGKGYLSEKTTTQFYCEHCDRFLADRYVEGICPFCNHEGARGDQCESCGRSIDQIELIEPHCVTCGNKPVIRETSHWFLNLKHYQHQIRDYLDKQNHWKENVKNFCYGWLNTGLEDRAVTRDLKWGVPVPLPGYEDKVLYVWFDAPIGYISSTIEWSQKIGQPEKWKDYWLDKETRLIHFIGKDNIVFHAIIWPLILMGHGDYVLPSDIPANEFLNLEGNKLSTSKNYAVWLDEYLAKFPPDPLRYCIAVNAPETKDSDFSWKDFQTRNNSELADILGNFVNRTLTFVNKNFDSKIPEAGELDALDQKMLTRIRKTPNRVGNFLENFEVRKALTNLMDLARFANKYFNDQTPWSTIRENPEKCKTTLNICCRVCKSLAILMQPFLPFSAEKLWSILNQEGVVSDCQWDDAAEADFPPGFTINSTAILFEKIEDDQIQPEIDKLKNIIAKRSTEDQPEVSKNNLISYDEFSKVQLRVARVLEAERVEKADKLLKLKIELGDETRQIVAGIAPYYQPSELVGKLIVVVANLEPAKIRGIESNGMLLAASLDDRSRLALVTVDSDITTGAKIK
ncbi:methionine--tRNA ligase [candidate division KSB1 bacterium]|nr:methionine--tRNA ligase [candidate division KSB1 bacterium]